MKPSFNYEAYRALEAYNKKNILEENVNLELQSETLLEVVSHVKELWNAIRLQGLHVNDIAQTNFRLAIFGSYYGMFFNHMPPSDYVTIESELQIFIVTDRALLDQCEIVQTDDGFFAIYGNIDSEEKLNTYRELVAHVRDKEAAEMIVLLLKLIDNEFKRLSA